MDANDSMKARAQALAHEARSAARTLGIASTEQKNAALRAIARRVRTQCADILAANAQDLAEARAAHLSDAMLDRLKLDERRVEAIASALADVEALPDPVGEVTRALTRPNGLNVRQVRIPLGVILMIYEARPNVTPDAAALCLKSGNAVILRGGKEALASNLALGKAIHAGLTDVGLPTDAVQLLDTPDRDLLLALLQQDELIDLAIPRGGEGLIRFVAENARVPVLKHFKGVCHVFLHASADLDKAMAIAVNAKAQRPGVCNAAECLLVERAALHLLPPVARALIGAGVELRACPEALVCLCAHRVQAKAARDDDFGREFLDKIMAIQVVDSLDGALDHIARHGSLHTEAIVAEDGQAIERFTREVVASAVMVNASTRFNDGGELGLGAEIGISTTKLHAFGPMGLEELTARKFVVTGNGQIRG
ncbi:MAG: glutamate-5-semialdehyde dehydrogenase [Myxococcales bacterium]|nr:glutamate-5-semialdehyde dehydrogenase [Myxococcales bacterium]